MAISGQTLTLSSADGGVELVLTAGGGSTGGDASLTGTAWSLVDLDGEPAVASDGMTVTFGEDGAIDGFGGCNQIFGDYTVDGSTITVVGPRGHPQVLRPGPHGPRVAVHRHPDRRAVEFAIAGDELTIAASDGAELILQRRRQRRAAAHPRARRSPPPAPEPTTPRPRPDPVDPGGVVGPTWVLSSLMDQPMPVGDHRRHDRVRSGRHAVRQRRLQRLLRHLHPGRHEPVAWPASRPARRVRRDATKQGIQDGLLQVLPFMDTGRGRRRRAAPRQQLRHQLGLAAQ